MSRSLAPVPADNFALPVPSLRSEHSQVLRRSTDSLWSQKSRNRLGKKTLHHQNLLRGVWRHTIGISLLLATVVLWTASNFLASVGVVKGDHGAQDIDRSIYRLSSPTIATLSHILLLISTHRSCPSCCCLLPQGDYGPAVDL